MLPDRNKTEQSSRVLPVPLSEPQAWHGGVEGRLERDRAHPALDPTAHTPGASSVPRTVTCCWPVSHPCRAKPGGDLSFTQLLLFPLSCTQHCHSSALTRARGAQQHHSWSSRMSQHSPFTAFLYFFMSPPGACSEVPGWFAPLWHFLGHPVCREWRGCPKRSPPLP